MDANLTTLPDDIDALKAAPVIERAGTREVVAERDVGAAGLAAAWANASEELALIVHQEVRIAKLERQIYGPGRRARTGSSTSWRCSSKSLKRAPGEQAPAPFPVVASGMGWSQSVGDDSVRDIAQHQPLNRQSERYALEGVTISLSTMADAVGSGCAALATTPDHAPYTKTTMAADMAAVMTWLGHERFMVGSHDSGARVAHRLALHFPDRVAVLTVFDTVPPWSISSARTWRLPLATTTDSGSRSRIRFRKT